MIELNPFKKIKKLIMLDIYLFYYIIEKVALI
jgi:hypothetical protein